MLGRWVTVQELLQIGLRDRLFYDVSGGGVTLTGGEVAEQAEFVVHFLHACKTSRLHTAIETSGFAVWDKLACVAGPADLILYDLKLIDPHAHRKYIGVDNSLILSNLRTLKRLSPEKEIQVRVPCIPGISDTEQNVRETADFVSKLDISRLALLPYNQSASAKYRWLGRHYVLSSLKRQSASKMEDLKAIAMSFGLHVEIVG
jgi:pyruvate formate lyase activating enzyme